MISLFIGGARSGKSGLAEQYIAQQANATKANVVYVATAEAKPSMAQRIALHQQSRPAHWTVIEEPLALDALLLGGDYSDQWLIIDCLTLWLTNHLIAGNDLSLIIKQFTNALAQTDVNVVLVSTETGLGLVPEDDMSQAYVIASGELHQAVARCADNVCFCHAGLPNVLKGSLLCLQDNDSTQQNQSAKAETC